MPPRFVPKPSHMNRALTCLSIFFLLLKISACAPNLNENESENDEGGGEQSNTGDNATDSRPTLRIVDATINENDSVVEIGYLLSNISEEGIVFIWSAQNGSALAGSDFEHVGYRTEVISPRTLEGSISISIFDDELNEDIETFQVNIVGDLLNNVNTSGSTLSATITIADNDPEPTINLVVVDINEDAGTAEMVYTLSAPSGKEVSFAWATEDGTAQAGNDYTAVTTTPVTLREGQWGGVIAVPIVDDSHYEPFETIKITILESSLNGIAADGSHLNGEVYIYDNDFPILTLSTPYTISEGAGEVIISYLVTPSNIHHDVNFTWITQPDTATRFDFGDSEATDVVVPAGTNQGYFTIPLIDDSFDEENESFSIQVEAETLQGIDVENSQLSTTITIADDDSPPTIELYDLAVEEDQGRVEITYHLSAPSGREVSFSWSTSDGTATAGSDYQAVSSRTTTISPGLTTGVIPVTLTDDTSDELRETFLVTIDLSSLTGITAQGSNHQATVTIVDRPFLRLQDIKIDENDGIARVPYSLSSPSSADIQFNWSTQDGTATIADSDYTAQSDIAVTITAGDTSGTLNIDIANDSTFEDRETLAIAIDSSSLSGLEDITDSDLTATVTIIDEEDMNCASNYIKVIPFDDEDRRLKAFCVAKYEMKNGGSDTAISSPDDRPWVNLTYSDAVSKCSSISGNQHTLISNRQWQIIARNIEAVAENWHSQFIGSRGGINRGHSDGFPASVLPARGNDNLGCFQTGQECNGTLWSLQKRTHKLLNGEIIWDFAGNASEWVFDTNPLSYGYDDYISLITSYSHSQLNVLGGHAGIAKEQFGPARDYSYLFSENFGGLGYGYLEITHGEDDPATLIARRIGILRGGGLADQNQAGIFATQLGVDTNDVFSGVKGFRCTYRPNP